MNSISSALLCLVLFATLQSCESPERGCLDVEATNFDVSADKPCEDDCCKYPQLVLAVNQEFNGAIWKQDTAYRNDLGKWFRIKSISYYLSDIKLTQNGEAYTVSDSVQMRVFGANAGDTLTDYFTDDYLLVRRNQVDYTVGTFKTSGSFQQFSGRLGLSGSSNDIVPRYAPSGHPLAKQSDSLWLSRPESYVMMQIILTRDTNSTTTPDTLRFTEADLGSNAHTILRTGNYEHETGFNFELILTADYYQLFKGVDFAISGISAWKTRIIANLSDTFDVSQ